MSSPDPGTAIAIIGMSGRFPGAPDVDTLWSNLRAGRESVSRFTEPELLAAGVAPELARHPDYVPAAAVLADIEQFDADFFRFTAREAECTDPQHRILLECAWEALESAGYLGPRAEGRVGVYAGAGGSNYWMKNLAGNAEALASVSELQLRIGNAQDYAATRISYKLDLTGPSLTLNTACSTSLVAVHMACQGLLDCHCDLALAGGVSIQVPMQQGYLHTEGGIGSPDGHCRPFDSRAQGTLTGSGAGIVVLRRLEEALAAGDTIHAILLGTAVNNDGANKIGYTAPSERGQRDVIAEALGIAGVSPETVTLLEAHGTATALGDPIEVAALTRVFREHTARRQFCALGSIKSNFGHLDEAAGVAGLIKTVLALRHRTLPPSLHFERPNPKLELESSPFFVATAAREWLADGPRRAGVSSFGIGGTNAHAVLEEAPPVSPSASSPRPTALLILSARTRTALDALCRNLADHFERHPDAVPADTAFTLAVGRRAFQERRAFVCASVEDAIAQLRSGGAAATAPELPRRVVFLFPGQGAQYAGMGAGLYRAEPVFRAAMDECAQLLQDRAGLDLLAALFPSGDGEVAGIDETALAQPALFSIEYALAALLRAWGLEPEAMLGHSLGEYVAATVAGVFGLEDALALVAARGRLMQSTARGAMLAVPLSSAELAPLVAGGALSIAAVNAPASSVLSGLPEAIAAAEVQLAAHGPIRLRTSHAFHSPLMEPVLAEFEALVRRVRLSAPRVRFVSNVTGDWITPAQATDPAYWVRHARQPVRFAAGVECLLGALPDAAWIELGPGRALASLVERHPAGPRVLPALPSARSKAPDSNVLLSTLGALWAAGAAVDWAAFFQHEQRRRVPLPTYPFERKRYWIDPPKPAPRERAEPAAEEVRASPIDGWFFAPRWRQAAKPAAGSFAGQTWVIAGAGGELANAAMHALRRGGARAEPMRGADAPAGADVLFLAAGDPADDAAHDALLGLLALAQGLDAAPRRLAVVTSNTQAVAHGSEVTRPGLATLWGATRVVAKECPNLQCATIDLDLANAPIHEAAEDLLAALRHPAAEMAVRGGALWEQRIEPAPPVPAGTSRLREGGVWLITGGLGSMGLAFAEYLARTARARLALVSRRGLDGETARFSLLARSDAISEIERAAGGSAAPLAAEPGLEPLLNAFCSSLLREYVAPGFSGLRAREEDVRARLGVLPKFGLFFERLLGVLAEDGIVRSEAGELELRAAPLPETLAAELAARFPRFVPLANLIAHCVHHFPQALSGAMRSLAVLYPDGTPAWLDAAMAGIPDYAADGARLRAAATLVAQLAAASPEPLRILEVGGGTGTLTAQLAGLIAEGRVEYHFTDLGAAFVAGAKDLAAQRGLRGVRFSRFDITQPPEPQGLRPHSYDLVLGYNVVHATPDLVATARNLRSLLAEGGGLVLVETVQPPRWVDLIWGLTDGWWAFTDRQRRTSSPLVSLEEWERVLADAGFTSVSCHPRDPDARRRTDAGLIVAQTTEPAPRASAIRERIRAMEAAGAEVCVIAADVSDPGALTAAVATAEARLGPISGVIHTAGVLGQTLLHEQRAAEVRRVLAPKVEGTLHLAAALAGRPLDCFLLCSSLGGLDPLAGQFDYAAANTFLDAFAHARAACEPGLTVSIDWGFWQELGMIDTARLSDAEKQALRDEIEANRWGKLGVEIFARILASEPRAQWIVTPHPPAAALPHPVLRRCIMPDLRHALFEGSVTAGSAWFIDEHRVAGRAVLPGSAYLDMAVAAFRHCHGHGPVELRDVGFLAPMFFEEGQTRLVRLVLDRGADGCQFRVFTESSPDRWQLHARGEARALDPAARGVVDLAASEARMSPAEAPEGFQARVASFTPHWRNIARAAFGPGEGVARLELPPALAADLPRFALHPALLDTATGFMAFRGELDAFVPFHFGRVAVFDSLPPRCATVFRLVCDDGAMPVLAGSVVDDEGRELVRVEDYTLREALSARGTVENVQLEIGAPGDLRTLVYRPAPRRNPRAGEVEIEVRAAGLNFIEVLYAAGLLPSPVAGRVVFGEECAGVVSRVGEGVTAFRPGDEVIGYGAACFSLFTTLDTATVAPKPPQLSFEEAAGLPAACLTAWHGLVELARLRPGERVLIHAAAGGVGLAAVRIAQWRGAEIFATAGSEEKRSFLRGLGVAHVMDSRSLRFAEEVRAITGGEGVDVVLNSLKGAFLTESVRLLRRHGRFVELGKRDIFADTALGLGAFSNFIAFFAVDIGPDLPDFAETWRELTGHFHAGTFNALPCRVFDGAAPMEAFEHMSQARHIGKVVLSFADRDAVRAAASAEPAGLRWEEIVGAERESAVVADGSRPAEAQAPARHERPQIRSDFRAPESATEKLIAGIWESVLGVAPIGAEDRFFELNGDSLLAQQVMARLKAALDAPLPLSLIFNHETVRALAAQVDARTGTSPAQYEEGAV
jgi:acyl transferase domain-containing protein/acyl carrier protein